MSINETIERTPNPDCGDCRHGKMHGPHTWAMYHPLAGHGYAPEIGWTYPKAWSNES